MGQRTQVAGGLSLKGCQIVAGGRSVAQTTGQQSRIIPHPERVSEKRWHPSGVRTTWAPRSGGLRYAATTGYYLTALQAENPLDWFSHDATALRLNRPFNSVTQGSRNGSPGL